MSISNSSTIQSHQLEDKKVPIQISKDVLNAATLAAMDDAENGENIAGPFDSINFLMEALT